MGDDDVFSLPGFITGILRLQPPAVLLSNFQILLKKRQKTL
jgi:hypothetical protein